MTRHIMLSPEIIHLCLRMTQHVHAFFPHAPCVSHHAPMHGPSVHAQVDDTDVINFLLSTEIIPLCLRTMEIGSELSKTVATFIVQKILLDDVSVTWCDMSVTWV